MGPYLHILVWLAIVSICLAAGIVNYRLLTDKGGRIYYVAGWLCGQLLLFVYFFTPTSLGVPSLLSVGLITMYPAAAAALRKKADTEPPKED